MSKKRVKILDMFTTPSSILGMSRFYENPRNQPSARPRFSLAPQTQFAPEPPNQTRTLQSGPPNQTRTVPREPLPGFLDTLGNLVGAANPLSNYRDVGESTIGLGVGRDQANVYAPQTTGAIAEGGSAGLGDVAKDLAIAAGLGVAGKVAGAGIGAASAISRMSPAAKQAYLNSISGRLYHGTRSSEKFDVDPTAGQIGDNFFDANFFATTSKKLAETPGYGQGSSHRVRMPFDTAKNLNVLDLYPGAPSVRDQFPRIADDLQGLGLGGDISVQGTKAGTKDLGALQRGLDDPMRYASFAKSNSLVPNWNDWLSERGVNAVRHQSGAYTNNDLAEPVFAFFNPQGLSATPNRSAGEILQRAGSGVSERINSLLSRLRRPPVEDATMTPPAFG